MESIICACIPNCKIKIRQTVKCLSRMPIWTNRSKYVPDIIFTEREKDMFGEVFGMEGNEDYNLKKVKKMKIAQDCKDKYDFWYWDITKSKEPPAYDKPAF